MWQQHETTMTATSGRVTDGNRPYATMITANSGSGGTPENSLHHVRHAMSLEVDALEVDVRFGRNGTLILAHDVVGEFASADSVPLSDVFSLLRIRPEISINCDMKDPGLEWPVWLLANEYGMVDRLIYTGVVSEARMKAHPELRRDVEWFYNLELRFPDIYTMPVDAPGSCTAAYMAMELRKTVDMVGASCLHLHWRTSRTHLWEELDRFEIPLSVWTPDEPDIIQSMFSKGVRNITTRQADRAIRIRKKTQPMAVAAGSLQELFYG